MRKAGEGANLDLGGASTRGRTIEPKVDGAPPPRLARRRKAPPAQGAKHFGPYTHVAVGLRRTRGPEAWVEVTTSTGRWYVNADAAVGDLVDQLIRGGHWVYPPSTT